MFLAKRSRVRFGLTAAFAILVSLFVSFTLVATPVFYSLFNDLGTPRWVRALGKAPAAIWNRFAWGWLHPANGRRSPS